MSVQHTNPDFSVEVVRQDQYDAKSLAGTLKPGNPYDIGNTKSPLLSINNTTAPTTATVGEVGDIYKAIIGNNHREWVCVAVNGGANGYIWRETLTDIISPEGNSYMYQGKAYIPMADNNTNGLISSTDKVKLDNVSEIVADWDTLDTI